MSYADDQLRSLEELLSNSIETSQARYESLLSTLRSSLNVVTTNRSQLFPATAVEQAAQEPETANIPSSDEQTEA
jgi:hypothetical protein